MHDLLLILTSKLNIMIIQTLEKNENYFLVFCITIFLVKAQNKIRQSLEQGDLFINDANS